MKLKTQQTDLSRVIKALDRCGAQYMKTSVDAVDKEQNKSVPTEVVMCSLVFHRISGAYLFSGPIVNPPLPGPNHKPE